MTLVLLYIFMSIFPALPPTLTPMGSHFPPLYDSHFLAHAFILRTSQNRRLAYPNLVTKNLHTTLPIVYKQIYLGPLVHNSETNRGSAFKISTNVEEGLILNIYFFKNFKKYTYSDMDL